MKIVFPIEIFYPVTVGGPSSTLYWHTNYLAKNGFDICIIATNRQLDHVKYGIKLNSWFYDKGKKIIFCKTKFRILPIMAIFETFKSFRSADVVHYSSAYYYLTIYTIFIAIISGKKVFLSPRGEFFNCAIDSFKKKIIIFFYTWLQKKITFHATSEAEAETIRILFKYAKIVKQPNFIDASVSLPSKFKTKNIVFLGIIYEVKQIENVIIAFSKSDFLKSSSTKFLIAGAPLAPRDFEYKNKLSELIVSFGLQNKVIFVGEKFGDDKINFLSEAYLLVLPSVSENFGNVIVEALSLSTPAIASTGTPWEILNQTNAGWWIDCAPSKLRECIEEAIKLPSQIYYKICDNARQLVIDKYNIHTTSDNKWNSIYKE